MQLQTHFELDLLRALLAVVDAGAITRAARILHRTQAAVSQQIQRLEGQAGQRLLHRTRSGVRPTAAGELMLGYARRIVALHDEAASALATEAPEGAVRLGVMDDYATVLLPGMLAHFAGRYPRVCLETETGLTGTLLKRLGRDFDLVLAMHREGDGGAAPVCQDEPVWAVGPNLALLEQSPLPLALYPQGCLLRDWAIEALNAAGIRWRMAYLSSNTTAVEAAAAAGLAITVVKRRTLRKDLHLLEPGGRLPPLPRADIVLHAAPGPERPAVRAARDFLTDALGHV